MRCILVISFLCNTLLQNSVAWSNKHLFFSQTVTTWVVQGGETEPWEWFCLSITDKVIIEVLARSGVISSSVVGGSASKPSHFTVGRSQIHVLTPNMVTTFFRASNTIEQNEIGFKGEKVKLNIYYQTKMTQFCSII